MTLIKIILALVILTVVISYLSSNVVLASTIRVTQQQAELIEWCTKEMVRVTDASMVQSSERLCRVLFEGRIISNLAAKCLLFARTRYLRKIIA